MHRKTLCHYRQKTISLRNVEHKKIRLKKSSLLHQIEQGVATTIKTFFKNIEDFKELKKKKK